MFKYWDGKRWVVKLPSGEEACGVKLPQAERLAQRMLRNEVVYLVGRPAR